MVVNFIDILKEIRGTGENINDPGNANNAGSDVTPETGGIWQRLKDKERNMAIIHAAVEDVKHEMYASDNDNSILANITAKNDNVNIKSANVDTKASTVGAQFDSIAGTTGDGTADGMYYDIVARESQISPHYTAIDNINNDINGKDTNGNNYDDGTSKVIEVGKNIAKGTNSELLTAGKDLISTDSAIKNVYAQRAEITTINEIKDTIATVAGDHNEIRVVGIDLERSTSDVREVSLDLQDVNSSVRKVGEDLYKNGTDYTHDDYSHVKHAAVNALTATTKAQEASVSATAANESKVMAQDAEILAAQYRDRAGEWSDKATEVIDGRYSAKYWAEQAADVVTDGILDDDTPNSLKVYSSKRTNDIVKVILKSMLQLSDGYAISTIASGALEAGDTVLNISVSTASDNSNTIVVDEDNETITLKRATSYSIWCNIRFKSTVADNRTIVIKLIDADDNTLASHQQVLSIPDGDHKYTDFVLPLDITSEKVCKVQLHIDDDGYEIDSGTVYVMSSITQDIDVDMTTIYNGTGLTTAGYTANSSASYINDATTLQDADNKIDTQLKDTTDLLDKVNGSDTTDGSFRKEVKTHTDKTDNPHNVSKAQVGLGNVTDDAQIKLADMVDEDDMVSDSDTKVPTQQSVKGYVDQLRSETLLKGNTDEWTPSNAYEPATKGYVDAMASSSGGNVEITKKYRAVAEVDQTVFFDDRIAQVDRVTIDSVDNDTDYKLNIDGNTITYTSDSDATEAEIVQGLIDAINDSYGDVVTASADEDNSDSLLVTADTKGVGFTIDTVVKVTDSTVTANYDGIKYILGSTDVVMNGTILDSDDYTAANGYSIELAEGAEADDIITLIAYGGADVYNKTQTDALMGAKANKVGTEDIEITDVAKGVILKDRGNDKRYRLYIENDQLGIEEL